MQIRRSSVVCLLQDSMILSYQVNCTGTHLRERTLLFRKVGRSDPTNDAEKAPRIASKLIMDSYTLPSTCAERQRRRSAFLVIGNRVR